MESCVAEFARPPRVMHLISSSGFLGAENVVLELALQSRKTGLDVQIGVMVNAENPNLELAEIAAKNGFNVTVHQCSGRLDKRVIGVIKGLIHDNGIDIVHSHNYKSNFYAWRALCGTPCKWVITNHGRRSGFRLLLYNLADAFVARHADRVIAVSDRIFRMLRCAGVPDCKVRIIDNGIDTDRFAGRQPPEGLEVSLGIPADALVIGSVGALTLEKGHVYLLRASSAVLERFPLAVFLIIGDGPERAALKKEACKLGISEHVVFAGKRKDIPELLNIMDIFVLPSLQEGLPMAMLEAQAARVPVIASSVGAIPGVLQDGATGLLVPPGNSNNLSSSIIRLLSDRENAGRMAERGFARVKDQYSAEQMARKYLATYHELMSDTKGKP